MKGIESGVQMAGLRYNSGGGGLASLSGPGAVTFGDANAVDTTADFTADGTYVLELEVYDGEFTVSDTVEIDVVGERIFFADDFEDNDLAGWSTLEGSFETFQFLTEPAHVADGGQRLSEGDILAI